MSDSDPTTRLRSAVVAGAVTAGVMLLLFPLGLWARGRKADQVCRSNLHRLGVAMWIYQGEHGGSPYGGGSDALLRLSLVGIVTDPQIFLCPATSDDNDNGQALRWSAGRMPRNVISYAGPRRGSRLAGRGDVGASEVAVASDDQEGEGGHFNHGDHCHVLFLDGHVERIDFEPENPPKLGRDAPLESLRN